MATLAAPVAQARPPVPTGKTDTELKAVALKLNDLTTTKAMDARLKELAKNKDEAKRIVKLAAGMQRAADDKTPAFKFNAVIVLGELAASVKEYGLSEQFYDGVYERALKLGDADKSRMVFFGTTAALVAQKKYAALETFCKKVMEAEGDVTVTSRATEYLIRAKAWQGDTDEALTLADKLVEGGVFVDWLRAHRQGLGCSAKPAKSRRPSTRTPRPSRRSRSPSSSARTTARSTSPTTATCSPACTSISSRSIRPRTS